MRVVIDSNIIARDFHLSSSTSRVFLSDVSKAGHEVFVPEIVLDEVANKYEEQVRSAVQKADSGLRELERLARIKVRRPIGERKIASICGEHRAELRENLSAVAEFLAYPDIGHHDLVRRALSRRKPFKEKGGGYRDALIWWNVVELARLTTSVPIALISGNSTDFATSRDKPDELHADLVEDLFPAAGEASDVHLYPNLETFVSNHILPELERNEQMATQLAKGTYPDFNLLSFVQDELVLHVGSQEFEAIELGFFLGIQTANFAQIESIDEFVVDSVHRLSTGEALITVTLEGEVSFDVYVPRDRPYGLRGGEPLFVWDSDWSDWFALATTQLLSRLNIRIVLEESSREVISAEISSVELLEEWWRRFSEHQKPASDS
ncbi:MAG: PIN domain-containing protein [Anaerolineales bacterium]